MCSFVGFPLSGHSCVLLLHKLCLVSDASGVKISPKLPCYYQCTAATNRQQAASVCRLPPLTRNDSDFISAFKEPLFLLIYEIETQDRYHFYFCPDMYSFAKFENSLLTSNILSDKISNLNLNLRLLKMSKEKKLLVCYL